MEFLDISRNIKHLDINDRYCREIFGLGEVYEIISIEHIRNKLSKKYPRGTLHLASNKNHSDRGLTLQDLEEKLAASRLEILCKGFADSPPWPSKPLDEKGRKNYNLITINLAKLIFFCLIKLENLWEGPEKSHMIYCLTKKL